MDVKRTGRWFVNQPSCSPKAYPGSIAISFFCFAYFERREVITDGIREGIGPMKRTSTTQPLVHLVKEAQRACGHTDTADREHSSLRQIELIGSNFMQT
jgi:hypothetical protein